jgi:hypothetical protein
MARSKAPPCDGCPLDADDLGRCEEGLRQLEGPKATIAWCKRAGIPVEAAERDVADLERFFQGILAASKGPQSSLTGVP